MRCSVVDMVRNLTSVSSSAGTRLAERSLGEHFAGRLESVLRALNQEGEIGNSLRLGKLLGEGWWEQDESLGPRWGSDVTDDHTPFEFSLALDGRTETLRILTEPQDPNSPSLQASWSSAASIHERLVSEWQASLASLARVEDLFAPRANAQGRFAIWHSAVMDSSKGPQFKVYLNPLIHGSSDAPEVLLAALERLGLTECWQRVAPSATARGRLDQPIYFSLDLRDDHDSRVKIYVAHHGAQASDLARVLASYPGFDRNLVKRYCTALLGSAGPYHSRPPITCYAIRRSQPGLFSATMHLPVRCYRGDDFEVARTVCRLLRFPQRIRYMRALTAVSRRPLDSTPGLQTYVSLRASPGIQAVTVYLAPQVYSSILASEAQMLPSLFEVEHKVTGAV